MLPLFDMMLQAQNGMAMDAMAKQYGLAQEQAAKAVAALMPAFASGQWAGTVPATWKAIGSDDLLFMAGGGILAHPDGAAAGVTSIRQAWSAARAGVPLADAAKDQSELARALAFFGKP